jgi:hypothetical protein
MGKLFKIVASRAGQVVYEDRIEADSPRAAREGMKTLMGLRSLSGIVYTITEIPVDLIRGIVDARLAEASVAGDGRPGLDLNSLIGAAVQTAVNERLRALERRLTALEERGTEPRRQERERVEAPAPAQPADSYPDWAAIRAHYEECGSPKQTAARFNLSVNTLKGRIRREGWSRQRTVWVD